jgi:RimJ/RimL family protein N-acetyltransferase
VIEGRFIRLEPLEREHRDELYRAIGHPEVFAGGYGGGPAGLPSSAEAFASWAQGYYQWDSGNVYGIRLLGGGSDGRLVGTTTLGDFELAKEAAHIGWTAYHPSVWETAVNPEAKLLLLGLAFDHGFGRVKLQADALNDRSRAAIAKLGATFEGVLRRDRLRADGTWSGTAVFSVLVDEWPRVRAGLLTRLEQYAGQSGG